MLSALRVDLWDLYSVAPAIIGAFPNVAPSIAVIFQMIQQYCMMLSLGASQDAVSWTVNVHNNLICYLILKQREIIMLYSVK